jgi:dTDP-4-amino-4,6-dideoxygalactose transaminase
MSQSREIPFGRPNITDEDRRAVLEVLSGHVLTHGPHCKAFEAEMARFLGPGASCVSVSSCMAALHLAYLHLGIGPGDEVIVPALTHTATVHAVEWVGARPVFVDCDLRDGNVRAEAVEAAATKLTRAVGIVHFAGIPCDLAALGELTDRLGLRLVEDCALALGARFRGMHVGLRGDAGCFSFYPVKHITTAEGGMFVSRHPVEEVARLRAFGVDRSHGERAVPGYYDVTGLGLNYRMSELSAALGRSQLGRFEDNLAGRRARFGELRAGLARIEGLSILDATSPDASSSHYCLIAVLPEGLAERRADIVAGLGKRGVGTSIYYPHPVPRLTYYRNKYGYDAARFPNAARISDHSIALPVGWHLGADDTSYIVGCMEEVIREVRRGG